MVSGSKALSVFEFELDPQGGDPREQIRRVVTDLPPNTNTRIICTVQAIPLGMPIWTGLDFDWYREDLNWVFVSKGDRFDWAKEWAEIANHLRTIR